MVIEVLGPLRVRDLQGRRVPLGRPKQRELLALLTVHAGTTISADSIIDRLWEDGPPLSARANLHTYMSALRSLLQAASLAAPDRQPESVPNGYRLRLADGECDASLFETTAAQGRRELRAGHPATAAETLSRALGLWRGEVLEDVADRVWAAPFAAHLDEVRIEATEDQFEARLRLGQHHQLIAELDRLRGRYPLREGLCRLQLQALHRLGRGSEALIAYNEFCTRLEAELGAEPGPQLRQLHRAIRGGEHPRSTAREPAERPATSRPLTAPPAASDFTGRDTEATALAAVLLAHAGRSVSPGVYGIYGMAGVGKTCLAVEIAHELRDEFPDGQLYVDLRGADAVPAEPSRILASFLRMLGVDPRAAADDPHELAALYRSALAGRRVLVLLDNAASAHQVRSLLPGAGGSTVLITSRVPLTTIEGSRWRCLEVLSVESAVALLSRMVADGRVGAQPEGAVELANHCGGLPLALRIAAARLAAHPGWTVSLLARALRDERSRLDQLCAGDLEVRASLQLSYSGLDPVARHLLRRLSLFDVPDVTALVAGSVMDEPAAVVEAALERLVAAQLLADVGADVAGQLRYRFHDLVRLFARERAELEDSGEQRRTTLLRGLGGWLSAVDELEERVPGPCYARIRGPALRRRTPWHDGVAASEPLVWFDAEWPTLRAAIVQASDAGLHDAAWDIAGCLERYWDIRGLYAEWEDTSAHVLLGCRQAGCRRGEAVMLRGLIEVRTWSSEVNKSRVMTQSQREAESLVRLFVELDEPRGAADAEVMVAWALVARGLFDAAGEVGRRALAGAVAEHHVGGEARALVVLAIVDAHQDRMADALCRLRRALEVARTLRHSRYESAVLQFLGIAHREIGEWAASRRLLEESLEISATYRDDYCESLSRLELAKLHLTCGDPRARGEAEAALAISREHRMGHQQAESLSVLGRIALAESRPLDAVQLLDEAVTIWGRRDWLIGEATALVELGRAHLQLGDDAAPGVLARSRALFVRLGQHARIAEIDGLLGAT